MKVGPVVAQLWTQPGGLMGTLVLPGRFARVFEARWDRNSLQWGSVNLIEKPLYVSEILAAARETA